MPVLTKGSFTLDLKIVKLGADLTEDDRQCAWELYTEMVYTGCRYGKMQ